MPSFVLLCSCVYNSVLYKYYFLSVFRVWGIPKHYDYLVPREVISLSLIRRGLEIGTWKLGLGNWPLEIGPWKLDPGNWALENVPLECGVHANLYPCYLKPLVLHHLGIHCPWKKDTLQHWCLAENPLEKGFLEFLPLEISVNRQI